MQKDFWQKNDGQKNEGGMDVSWGGRKMWGRKTRGVDVPCEGAERTFMAPYFCHPCCCLFADPSALWLRDCRTGLAEK